MVESTVRTRRYPALLKPIVLILIASACLYLIPVVLNNDYFIIVFQGLAVTYIAVLGLNILTGYAGQTSFGHAGFVAIGAYTSALLSVRAGLPFWLGLVVGPILAAIIGALLALPAMRARGPFLVMITTGFGLVAHSVAATWVPVTGGPMGISGIPRPALFGFTFDTTAYFYLAAGIALLLHILANNLMGSRWGRTLVALRDAPLAAESLGVNTRLWKTAAFSLSAAYAGVAGVFIAHRTGFVGSDSFGVYASLFYVMIVIFGGAGTTYGPLVGTLILGALPQIFAPLYDYYNLIYGAAILAVLVMFPEGVVGLISRVLPSRLKSGMRREKPPAEAWIPKARPVPMAEGTPLLELKQVEMSFGGLQALAEVDLAIPAGTVQGLMGPNGSGKTTLVNVVNGFYSPTGGKVFFGGHDTTRATPHALAKLGIARTFQTPQLFGELSAVDNVMIGFHTHMRAGFVHQLLQTAKATGEEAEFRQRALALLEFFAMADYAQVPAHNLAFGHQKLLEIARCVALQPAVLILDEPAGGAGPAEISQVKLAIDRLRQSKITVMMIEHHTDFLLGIVDKVTVLDFGRKIADGLPGVVRNDPRVIEAYLGLREETAGAAGQ